MIHIVNFSYGIGSWAEAKLSVARYGAANVRLLNADTRYEDEDTYAWGKAAAANVGAELVCIADGRDIWEVFFDERYLGNTRADPCSKILKRELCDRWIEKNYHPRQVTRHYGIHWSESDRLERIASRLPGWKVASLLCEPPLLPYEELHAWATREGLWQQKLYKLGFKHANCRGACVKQGQAGWKHLLEVLPENYLAAERKEEELRQYLGKDVSILRDRRGGETKTLTLRQFRERLQAGGACDDSGTGQAGCGCFSEPGPDA